MEEIGNNELITIYYAFSMVSLLHWFYPFDHHHPFADIYLVMYFILIFLLHWQFKITVEIVYLDSLVKLKLQPNYVNNKGKIFYHPDLCQTQCLSSL